MNNKYDKEINAVSDEISQRGDLWELYYQRGYLYYLNDEDEKAADDYRHAVSLGLDYIETPYYAFSNSNSKRRDFLLPEKIMVFLVLLMVLVAIFFQAVSFIAKIKGFL